MAEARIRKHIAVVVLFLLGLVGVQLLYLVKLSVWDAAELAAHPLNARAALAENDVRRGRILDRAGSILAESDAEGQRRYPYGAALAPVTGYRTERYGAAGMERVEGRALSGVTGDMDRMGPLRTLLRADAGYDVRLTVDAALSETAWRALGAHRGAVVVMDAATGAVLAMVSTPAVDPAAVARDWDALTARADSPLLNRVTQGLYPPGSTLKPLIADAALNAGVTSEDEVFTCTGELAVGDYVLHESHGEAHGKLNLADALRESCNVTFATLALRLGASGLSKAFSRFGVGEELTSPELMPAAAHVPELPQLPDGEIAQLGIGQGQILMTPLQMVLLADAFANGGEIMQPYLVDAVLSADGTALYRGAPSVWRTATTPARAALIDSYMAQVVAAGTGTAADVAGVRVTGKTGTAENATGTDHAWFIGSAERGGKKIVMAILVEEGGFGGAAAARIAHRLIGAYFEG
ncbi:penicillin-binding protein, transpeptidase domain protein [Selenomonas sp. oral taxon 137 str. F0430]|uniref:peptidoglycan D,D-transpeptidase FtsI family protein n=1 Tax=Selenomonas sp. oral taxon 137 TaxID=712531 RepID=UPI0001EB2179|nr:penicillin-binding transpeptidase domain-containing protein [Selenomonas sp. oral taxon 137]EFR41985.1 penicillin-binding protein, transpeptidase domain protein [Selenomonas sp. oral taxon 137 str. F0430]